MNFLISFGVVVVVVVVVVLAVVAKNKSLHRNRTRAFRFQGRAHCHGALKLLQRRRLRLFLTSVNLRIEEKLCDSFMMHVTKRRCHVLIGPLVYTRNHGSVRSTILGSFIFLVKLQKKKREETNQNYCCCN